MKAVKISLVVLIVMLLSFFVVKSLIITPPPSVIESSENESINHIQEEIATLGKLPETTFCKGAYDNIMLLIAQGYEPHPKQFPYGRFGNTQAENDQQKDILSKNLYAVYVEKFIRQGFFVFQRSEWQPGDLNFIRAEYQTLQISKMLERGSSVDKSLSEIQSILRKYDEIAGFIDGCRGFRYLETSINDSRFPIADVQVKINRAATYQNNKLENEYVNNCTRLKDGLNEIPQILFNAHVMYLNNKINSWNGKYANADYGFTTHADYSSKLNEPLQNEIEAMTNDIYHVANFEDEYNKLIKKWSDDNVAAYKYF